MNDTLFTDPIERGVQVVQVGRDGILPDKLVQVGHDGNLPGNRVIDKMILTTGIPSRKLKLRLTLTRVTSI